MLILAPQSVYYCVLVTILLSFFTLGAIRISKTNRVQKEAVSIRPLLHNGPYLFFLLLMGLVSGMGEYWPIPIFQLSLMDSGLPVQIASTVVALSVVVKRPPHLFSDRFMDHCPWCLLILLPVGILLLQYFIYALPSPVFLKVLVTLLAKHTTGMVLIMVSLRFISQQVDKKDLVLAMALGQGVRYLGTIFSCNR